MHPCVQRELANVIARPYSVIFERSWSSGEDPGHCKKANIAPAFKKDKKQDVGN